MKFKKPSRKTVRRIARVGAFALATGIAFMGAGNVWGFSALDSAGFGATGAVLGLLAVLLFNFAAKDELTDEQFDSAINQAIQQVQSQTADKDAKK